MSLQDERVSVVAAAKMKVPPERLAIMHAATTELVAVGGAAGPASNKD